MATRIVMTGMGVVSPLGVGVEPVWNRLRAGQSGLRRLPGHLVADLPAKVGGLVPDVAEDPEAGFDLDAVVPGRDRKKMDRFIQFALAAADEAIAQAGWRPSADAERERTATVIASVIGGFPVVAEAVRTSDKCVRRLSPFTVPAFLPNLAAGWVTMRHGFKGPLGAPSTACAAGAQAIGDAARMIRSNEADIAVCGGAEACFDRASLDAFFAARALSTAYNDEPARASRPFDAARDGFVLAEGAAVLVIESLAHASARGARPIAELVGYGTSADAYHLTAAPETAEGARRAMRAALAQAGVEPAVVDHVNAHATSTPVGDHRELTAIKAVFGASGGPAITSTKSATGHLQGAAGALEAVFTVLALRDGIMPPTLNLNEPDAAAQGMDLVGRESRRAPIDYALSNGFGFGGVNASVLFKRWRGCV